MVEESKQTYFAIRIDLTEKKTNEIYQQRIDNEMDLVLASMTVKNNLYKFQHIDKSEIIYYFQTEQRKGQLIKICERYLPNWDQDNVILLIYQEVVEETIEKLIFFLFWKKLKMV